MADKPVTREEKYLAYLTGDYTGELTKPITRKEKYLYELCLKGIGGEISPEEIKNAVNEYLEKNPVKPGATTEQAQQIEQNKTDIGSLKTETGSLKEDLAYKIDKPAIPPEVGKILKVTAVNEDGTFTCEWGDAPSGGGGAVYDVQIDGASIVQDGVANIPQIKGNNIIGVTKVINDSGLSYQAAGALEGSIAIKEPSHGDIDAHSTKSWRINFQPLTVSVLDYALKVGMCDGKASAWTDVERIAALLRMGCTVDDNGFVKWTAQEGA